MTEDWLRLLGVLADLKKRGVPIKDICLQIAIVCTDYDVLKWLDCLMEGADESMAQ